MGSDEAAGFADTIAGGLAETGLGEPATDAVIAKGTPERYRVEGVIGAGGMGRVLDATDLWFGRRVALKEILLDAAPASLIRRFILEALVTGNLEHPGIAAVHERGVRDGRPYYVMRKLSGRTLADALDGARSLPERLQLISALVRVAHTIAFAHERGVIHRDLKPENIILGSHDEVTVIDWGIARVRKLEHLDAPMLSALAAQGQTAVGSVVGTPAYMAPEQAAGTLDAVDERTDVFALGALLYHLLTGSAPYQGDTAVAQVAKALAVDCPPIEDVAPAVPAPLAAISARAMSRDPAARFASATEMAEALDRALTDALTRKDSRFINAYAGVVSGAAIVAALASLVLIFTLMPAWAEMGTGGFATTATATAGLTLGAIEFFTRGRHKLSSLVGGFVALTLMGGLVGAMLGIITTLRAARAPEVIADPLRFRDMPSLSALAEACGRRRR